MNKRRVIAFLVLTLPVPVAAARAQQPAGEELQEPPLVPMATEHPSHAQLRLMRDAVIEAIKKGDIEAQLQHVHPDIVVTWQNSEVCRGKEGLRAFMAKGGKDAFKGYKLDPEPDELTILHGEDTGISFGRSITAISLLGRELEFDNRWTATLVKEGGRWLLAGYHVSVNALRNPLMSAAKQSLYLAGGIGLVGGGLIGLLLGRRRRSPAAR